MNEKTSHTFTEVFHDCPVFASDSWLPQYSQNFAEALISWPHFIHSLLRVLTFYDTSSPSDTGLKCSVKCPAAAKIAPINKLGPPTTRNPKPTSRLVMPVPELQVVKLVRQSSTRP